MTTVTEAAVHPFQMNVSEEDVADLRRRLAATRFPDKELVVDQSQGVQSATIKELARYWGNEYDFRSLR